MAITRNSTGPGTVVLEAFDDEAGDAAYLSTEERERGCRAEADPDLDDRVCSFGTNPPRTPLRETRRPMPVSGPSAEFPHAHFCRGSRKGM